MPPCPRDPSPDGLSESLQDQARQGGDGYISRYRSEETSSPSLNNEGDGEEKRQQYQEIAEEEQGDRVSNSGGDCNSDDNNDQDRDDSEGSGLPSGVSHLLSRPHQS